MARINIEDSLFKDGAFLDLIIAMNSRHAAIGAVVEAFMIAQEFFLNEETNRLIPLSEWKRRKAVDLIIDCGLAELKGENSEFVYLRGSEKHFSWLLQRHEAGKKGGRPKKEISSDQNKQQTKETDESGRLSEVIGSNPLTLTLTHSLTHSLNSLENNIIVPTSKNEVAPKLKKSISKDLIRITSPNALADLLDQKNKELLFRLYGDPEFIKREFYKIQNWLDANPRKNCKTERGWLQFVSNWLERAWPQYQKNIPSNQAKATSVDELMSMMGWS